MPQPTGEAEFLESASADASFFFRWTGIVLISVFMISTLASAWPLALLEQGWQISMSRRLLNGSIFPLLGTCMIRLAQYIDRQSKSLMRLLQRIRALALWAAIGYVLLIPLQTHAGIKQLRTEEDQARQRLQQVSQAAEAIQKASTAAELRAAILRIPGIQAPRLPSTFEEPIPQLRERILEGLRPRIKAEETRLQNERGRIWERWLVESIRDGVSAALIAIGFAALGRPAATRPPLLWTLLNIRQLQGRRQQRQPADAAKVVSKGWLEGIEEDRKSDSGGAK